MMIRKLCFLIIMTVRQFKYNSIIPICNCAEYNTEVYFMFYINMNCLWTSCSTSHNHIYFNKGVLIFKSIENIYIYTINKKILLYYINSQLHIWPFQCGIKIPIICERIWMNIQYIQPIKHFASACLHVLLQQKGKLFKVETCLIHCHGLFLEVVAPSTDHQAWFHLVGKNRTWITENEKFISSGWPRWSKPFQFRCRPDKSVWTPLSRWHFEGIATHLWTGQECQSRSTSWQQPEINETKIKMKHYEKQRVHHAGALSSDREVLRSFI